MRKIYIKHEVCIGCHLCEVYCKLQHSNSKDLIKAFKRESPRPLARLRVAERGAVSLSVRCQHCDEAPCTQACLTGAITRDLMTGLPLWYQAFGERMIGGENYISPPHLARGLFVAAAEGAVLDPEQLAAKLDQPWCRADLYYIEKISAILRKLDRAQN